VPGHQHDDLLVSAGRRLAEAEHVGRVAALLGVANDHPVEVGSEQRGLFAALAAASGWDAFAPSPQWVTSARISAMTFSAFSSRGSSAEGGDGGSGGGAAANPMASSAGHREKHNKEHHLHRYDVFGTGQKLEPPTFITVERDRPTLTDVICELRDWYDDHATELVSLRARLAGVPPAEDSDLGC